MQTFSARLEGLREAITLYDVSLKRTQQCNNELKQRVDAMAKALCAMTSLFNTTEKCGICYGRKVDAALECGHCMCLQCANKSLRADKCPFCRKPVKELTRLFL